MRTNLDVIATTPIGDYPARLQLDIENGAVSGVFSMMGHQHPFSGGALENGNISLSMTVSTPLGTIPFTARGTFRENKLDCSAKTRLGLFRLRSV